VILDFLAEEFHLDSDLIAQQVKSRLQGLHGGDFDSKMRSVLSDVDRAGHRHGTLTSNQSPRVEAEMAIAIPEVPAEKPEQAAPQHEHKEHRRPSPREGPSTTQLEAKIEQVHSELQKDTHRLEQKIDGVSAAVEALVKKLEVSTTKTQSSEDMLAKLTDAHSKHMNRILATLQRHGEQMVESTVIHSSRPEAAVSDFKARGMLLSRAMGYREDYQALEQQLAKQEEDEEFLEVMGPARDERSSNGWMTTRSCT